MMQRATLLDQWMRILENENPYAALGGADFMELEERCDRAMMSINRLLKRMNSAVYQP
jgi:hypothetical protein